MSNSPSGNNEEKGPYLSDQALRADETFMVTHPWIRHYEQGVPTHVDVPEHPLTWLLEGANELYADHTAIIYFGTKLTYAQFARSARRFARKLQELGVTKGDRVAIALPNIPQYPIAYYGALAAGAVVVPTNPLYTEREIQSQLADSEAKVIVVLDMLYPQVRAARPQTALEHVIVASPADYLPPAQRALYPLISQWGSNQPEGHLSGRELREDPTLHLMHTMLAEHTKEEVADAINRVPTNVPVEASDLAVLQYTGGTTGPSKGAMLTHRNLLANAMQGRSWFPKAVEGEEVMLCVAPFFHSYGMTVGMNISLLLGASMVLVPRFKPKEVVKAIRQYHPTLFPGIPTMYLAIMHEASRHPEDIASIKFCLSGAAALPAKVQADFEAITHGKLVEGYGLSEAGPVTHANPLTDECRNGSIGLPLPDVEAAIVHQETGEPLPIGEPGELVVKGPNVMQGYWKRPEETEAIFRGGWLHTGDLAKMDADGYFYMVERIKDVIVTSGEKVFPREVEEVLFQHPAVAEAAVAGVPDTTRGEKVAAFVVLKAGVEESEKTRQELIQLCKQELTAYKVPRTIVFRASLPKSLIGKVIRRELMIAE
jgi:long-chain acyl-CoA synthetase